MYGHFMNTYNDSERFKDIQSLLDTYIIYISSTNEIHFTTKKDLDIFGFVLSYNNKPCYFKFDKDTFRLYPCNSYDLKLIDTALKKYIKSPDYKQFSTSTDYWGYTTIRTRKNKKECVLKLVEPTNKMGNVCIDNNLLTKVEKLSSIIQDKYPKVSSILDRPLVSKKKNICFLLEFLFRYDTHNSFYPYDKVWLKYM